MPYEKAEGKKGKIKGEEYKAIKKGSKATD
jgi:hypothetical protein